MQVLITTATAAGTQPIYLPYDKAPVPFGDPLAATLTLATPSVVTVPGYSPTLNDAVSITVQGPNGLLTTQAGAAGTIQVSTTYYVTPAGAQSFTLSTQKGTITSLASWSTLGQAGGTPIVHLLSNQLDGTVIPFKPGNTVIAENQGWQGGFLATVGYGNITLFGAPDLTTVYGNPLGPNTNAWAVIATVGTNAPKLIQLNYDWIVASGSTSTLVLLQN